MVFPPYFNFLGDVFIEDFCPETMCRRLQQTLESDRAKRRAKRQKGETASLGNVDMAERKTQSQLRVKRARGERETETRIWFLRVNQQVVCGVTSPARVRRTRTSVVGDIMTSGLHYSEQ